MEDIVQSVKLFEGGDCDNVITGMPARRSPYFNLVEEVSDNFEKFLILKGGKILNFNSETTIWDIEDVILKDLGEL